jgi:hypothetical protein
MGDNVRGELTTETGEAMERQQHNTVRQGTTLRERESCKRKHYENQTVYESRRPHISRMLELMIPQTTDAREQTDMTGRHFPAVDTP